MSIETEMRIKKEEARENQNFLQKLIGKILGK